MHTAIKDLVTDCNWSCDQDGLVRTAGFGLSSELTVPVSSSHGLVTRYVTVHLFSLRR